MCVCACTCEHVIKSTYTEWYKAGDFSLFRWDYLLCWLEISWFSQPVDAHIAIFSLYHSVCIAAFVSNMYFMIFVQALQLPRCHIITRASTASTSFALICLIHLNNTVCWTIGKWVENPAEKRIPFTRGWRGREKKNDQNYGKNTTSMCCFNTIKRGPFLRRINHICE